MNNQMYESSPSPLPVSSSNSKKIWYVGGLVVVAVIIIGLLTYKKDNAPVGQEIVEPKVETVSPTVNPTQNEGGNQSVISSQGGISASEKQSAADAYFELTAAMKADSGSFVDYLKKGNPEKAAEIQAEYEKDMTPEGYRETMAVALVFFGDGVLTKDAIISGTWQRTADGISVEITDSRALGGSFKFPFHKVVGKWYVDFAQMQ